MTVDEILETVRAETKMQSIPLYKLERESGLGQHTVYSWLTNTRRKPRLDTLVILLDALGLELVVRRKGART